MAKCVWCMQGKSGDEMQEGDVAGVQAGRAGHCNLRPDRPQAPAPCRMHCFCAAFDSMPDQGSGHAASNSADAGVACARLAQAAMTHDVRQSPRLHMQMQPCSCDQSCTQKAAPNETGDQRFNSPAHTAIRPPTSQRTW